MNNSKTLSFCLAAFGTVATTLSIAQALAQSESKESAKYPNAYIVSETPAGSDWAIAGRRGSEHDKLNLNDEQREQLVTLKSAYAVKTAKEKAELQADKKQMMLLMTQPTIDKQAVLSLNDKIKSLKSDLSDARVNHMMNAMNVMTAQQREKVRHHMLAHSISHHRMGHGKYNHASVHQHRTV